MPQQDHQAPGSDTPGAIREAIAAFLQQRLTAALAKPKPGADRDQVAASFRPAAWLRDAAKRAGTIRQVTHAVRFAHPDAAATSLYAPGNPAAAATLVGTHAIRANATPDVVGWAGALDIYAFLSIEVAGKSLLTRAREQDPALLQAFPPHPHAPLWVAAFAAVADPDPNPSSHTLAKQLYWPLQDGRYHLLAPLFPSSLVHRVWTTIRDDRATARDARLGNITPPAEIHDYRAVVVQRFGGAQPQNISFLNRSRHGENYLLASYPPPSRPLGLFPPLGTSSLFERRFPGRPGVQAMLNDLRDYLVTVRLRTNAPIRQGRETRVSRIVAALLAYAAEIQDLPPGWTAHPDCSLEPAERFWLDPGRSDSDRSFAAEREDYPWRDELCHYFGIWMNQNLETPKTPMDDRDHHVWADALAEVLRVEGRRHV